MSDCLNVRVKEGKVVRDNMGWGAFPNDADALALGGPVLLIDNFFLSTSQILIFGTDTDLFRYDEGTSTVVFITPRYETGTVSVTNGSAVVTGSGTTWSTNLKAGDRIALGASETDPEATWYTIDTVDSDTQVTLTANYAEATSSGEAYTARLTFTGGVRDYWRTESFPKAQPGGDDLWFATNGIDDVVTWDGVDDQVSVSTIGIKCKTLSRYKNMMIYGHITVSGDLRSFSIRNSAIGEPENVSTKEAAEFVVHDGVDPIVALVPLGDSLTIYGERSITLAQFVGPPLMFVFRAVIAGLGALAGRAIADFGDFHEFLGADAQYRFDGIGVAEIGSHVWREILRKQSPQRLDAIISHFDEENGELLWGMPLNTDADPENGSIERVHVEHYLEEVGSDPTPFTIREVPATAFGFFERLDTLRFSDITTAWSEQNFRWNDRFLQAAFPFNLFGDANGNVFILNERDSKAGAAITSYARFGRVAAMDGVRKGVVRRIYPFTSRIPGVTYTLDVKVWRAESMADDRTLAGTFSHDLTHPEGRFFVSPRVSARYMQIEFGTDGISEPWEISGYDIDIVPSGAR